MDSEKTFDNPPSRKRQVWQKAWPWIRRLLTLAFFVLIISLLVHHARQVEWQDVKQALLSYSPLRVGLAILFSLSAFAVYSCYDLFGRYYIKSNPPKLKTMMVAFISFAFNLNLGSLVGSIGLRFRMYSRLGLSKAEIAHIVGLTVSSNWLGYLLLAGIAFASGAVAVPVDWNISTPALRIMGAAFVLVVVTYLGLCAFSPKRTLFIRGHELHLPSIKVALGQLSLACCHWLLMGCVIYTFLYPHVDFLTLFGVVLVSSIAGAIAHVPGALGVMEAVFVALLSHQVATSQIFAALIAYRAAFYLLPLALALVLYVYSEIRPQHKVN